jgi:hypothetical protein
MPPLRIANQAAVGTHATQQQMAAQFVFQFVSFYFILFHFCFIFVSFLFHFVSIRFDFVSILFHFVSFRFNLFQMAALRNGSVNVTAANAKILDRS